MTLDNQPEDFGCESKDNVSIIVHGWLEGLSTTEWVNETIANLIKYRSGCVFFFDYSRYSKNGNYFRLLPHYYNIAAVLTKYLLHIGDPERIFIFGFSFGARLSVEAGIASFNGSIDRIDLCDPAGVGFDKRSRAKLHTLAAQNVACIDTSTNYGTRTYNCHQNFRMGACGFVQAAHGPYPKGSHGLCPYFYNSAFDYDFIPYNHYGYKCGSGRLAKLTPDVKMGFLGISYMNKTEIRGDIFIATSGHSPYVAVDPRNVYFNCTKIAELLKSFETLQFSVRSDPGDAAMMKVRNEIWLTSLNIIEAIFEFTEALDKSSPYKISGRNVHNFRKYDMLSMLSSMTKD